MPTRLPTTKSVVHNKNVTIAGLLGYTLGFASLFALLSSFTFLPVLTMIGTLSGQLLCSVWLQSKSVRWIVSVTTGGLFAIVAGLYGSNNPDAVRPIWVWGVAVIGCLIYGLIATSILELLFWVVAQCRLALGLSRLVRKTMAINVEVVSPNSPYANVENAELLQLYRNLESTGNPPSLPQLVYEARRRTGYRRECAK